MDDDFYKNVKGFEQFAQLSNPRNYSPAPAGWYVVATDVKNSTLAIEQGKYKEINLSGAAVIMSILNVAGDISVPYTFGGDGATLLIPASLMDKTLIALAAVQAKVKSVFDLELRAGCIPVQALYEAGASLLVAKFFLSATVSQSAFQGNALALAESWLKKGNSNVVLAKTEDNEPDLQGLECRWQPLQNRHGKILSLLVKVTPAYEKDAWETYADILREIESIYPDYATSNPATATAMQLSFSPAGLYREVKLRTRGHGPQRLLYLFKMLFSNAIGRVSFSSKKTILGFDGARYLRELVAQSDSRKFDEMLRMVLDSTEGQHRALEQGLDQRRQRGQITYGIHESSQALMTCLVFSGTGNHVHLIDGSNGGYALAAKQMKQQADHLPTGTPPAASIHEDAVKLVQRLAAVGMALSGASDLERLLEIILVEAKEIACADGGTLYYLTEENKLEFAIIRNDTLNLAHGGATGTKAHIEPLDLYDPVTNEANYGTLAVFAVLMQKPINIPDVYDADGFDFEGARAFDRQHDYRTHSVLAVPMVNHNGEVMGCLQLINARNAAGEAIPFTYETQQLVQSLASQAAVTLDNKKLVAAQKKLLESFIRMIAQAIDAKSHYTGAHCERVPTLTNMLAKAACEAQDGPFKDFTLSGEEKYELHIAGWIHDCGKVATPVHIMDKSTKLETICDRIELVKTRFELLRREARITLLEQSQLPGADHAALESAYTETCRKLDDDFAFIEKANIGGEFMSDAQLARLKDIAAQNALTENELYNLSIRKGTLTDEERKIMNDHMVHTCNMLDTLPFPKHLKRVPEYAGGHHERMDGKGYPKGIKAGTMSIPARMMAVADVFEALTAADRPYKPAKKLSEAMQIIGQMKKQNHLDPDLVDFFVTSKVYLEYAHKYLSPELIDAVDETALLAIAPLPL